MSKTMTGRALGILYGVCYAAALGLIPLFLIPLVERGVPAETVLIYRFGFGALMMLPLFRPSSLRVSPGELWRLAVVSGFFMLSMWFLFRSFFHLPSSVAVTLEYLYPVMVMAIMTCFFGEKFSFRLLAAVALVVVGVALLSQGSGAEADSAGVRDSGNPLLGICLALCAALANALLVVALKVSKISRLGSLALTFYMLAFAFFYTFVQSWAAGSLRFVWDARNLGLLFLMALVTAVLANVLLIWAIELVGPTLASILGVCQPLTSVCCGVLFLGEPLSLPLAAGIAVVLAAVLLVILKPGQERKRPRP